MMKTAPALGFAGEKHQQRRKKMILTGWFAFLGLAFAGVAVTMY
jgi:hypothetical protein